MVSDNLSQRVMLCHCGCQAAGWGRRSLPPEGLTDPQASSTPALLHALQMALPMLLLRQGPLSIIVCGQVSTLLTLAHTGITAFNCAVSCGVCVWPI